jgi:thiamine transport system permease protein
MTGRCVSPGAFRRLAGLAGLAAVPLLVLGVFFVLPVGGMLALGFWPDGRSTPGGVARGAGPAARVHRVLWFTVWSAGRRRCSRCCSAAAAHVLLPAAVPRPRAAAGAAAGAVRAADRGGRRRVPTAARRGPVRSASSASTAPGGDHRGLVFFNVAVVVRTVGPAWESLDPRPAEAAAASAPRPLQVFRTVTLPALRPAIVSAASVVFLFCATAFGVVLTLGGLRYASVETEIYLLTTNQLLDLQAAAALSVLQLVVVTVLLCSPTRARPRPGARPRGTTPARRPAGDDPACSATVLLLGRSSPLPIAALVVGVAAVDDGWSLANYRALAPPASGQALLVPVTDALAPRCAPPSTRPGCRCCSAAGRARGHPPLARGPSAGSAASSTASSCCRSASPR